MLKILLHTKAMVFVVTFLFSVSLVQSATYYSRQNGNWTTNTTWSTVACGGAAAASAPGATDNVIICAGHTVSISSSTTCTCGDITITGSLTLYNGSVLNVYGGGTSPATTGTVAGAGTINGVSSGGCDIKPNGNWSFNGTVSGTYGVSVAFQGPDDATVSAVPAKAFRNIYFEKTNGATLFLNVTPTCSNHFSVTTGTVATYCYNQAGAQNVLVPNLSYGTNYTNLTLAGSGAKTFPSGTTTVDGILSMEETATVTLTGTLAYGPAATLQYNTATSRTAGAEWITPFAATGGVIIANTGTITLNAAKVFNSGIPLTINSGATLNTSAANNWQLTFGGNFVNNGGTFTANASPIVIANTMATQSIDGFTTTGLVSMTKSSGTATFQGNVGGGGLTINGAGGTLNLGTGLTHTFTGTWTRTAGTLNGGSSLLEIGGSVSGTGGTFTAGSGTVEWYAAGAQTIANVAYNNLTLSGSGTKIFSGTNTIAGTLSINSAAQASLANGTTSTANALKFDDTQQVSGSWGSTGSPATHQNDTYFLSTATGIVTITGCVDPDIPTVSANPPTICSGSSSTLSITAGTLYDATEWQWYTVSCGGSSAGSGISINVAPTGNTTYYVRGEGGCVTPGSCAQVAVQVNPSPSAGVSGTKNVSCYAGSDGTITVNATGGTSPYYYSIYNGGATYVFDANNPHTFIDLQANYEYKIRVKDSNSCESPAIP